MLTASKPYRSGHALALTAVSLLVANLCVALIGALKTVFQLVAGQVSVTDEVSLSDLADLGVGLLQLLVNVATIVVFCVWLYRVYDNLTALGNPKQGLQYSPGWAVGSFFVPIINLFVPYRATKEVWAKSDHEVTTDNFVPAFESSPPSIFPLWWTFWLLSNFANKAATRLYFRAKTEAEMALAMYLDLLGDLLTVPAALFAIAVIRSIDRRQEERSRRVTYVQNVPPPPPLYPPPSATSASGGIQS